MDVKNLDLGYKFNNYQLLDTAFTHTSYANEHNLESYERMEYLGDSVLQLVVSEYLYLNFNHLTSGELSKYRSHLVSTKNLSTITKQLHFDKYMKIGKALTSVSDALMADLYESVLCAIYLDGGLAPAKEFVYKYVIVNKDNVERVIEKDKDYKTMLQEYLQSLNPQPKLEYILVKSESINNKSHFTMALMIDGKKVNEITALSKKECEKLLSKFALEKFLN